MKKARFFIEGMTCSACSSGIERSLGRKDFIKNIQVNLISKTAFIEFDEKKASLDDIFSLIKRLGYNPTRYDTNDIKNLPFLSLLKQGKFNALDEKLLPPSLRLIISVCFSLFVLYLAMLPMIFSPNILIAPFDDFKINALTQLISALIVMHMGRKFYFKGFASLFSKSPTMDTLIAISTSAAFVYSLFAMYVSFDSHHAHFYFESICVIITFVMLGKRIEEKAKDNANDVINTLLSRSTKEVIIIESTNLDSLDSTTERKIPIDQIKINDIIKILPSSYIPVDGVLVSGEGGVDESMLSGEVLPVHKKIGDKVFAGSLNTNQPFLIKATTTSAQNTLTSIISLIQEATSSKPKISRIADKVAAIFVPIVICIALVAGALWWIFKDFGFGLEIFISVLVISCPCALGLATPMAVMIGNMLANKNGIFFKKAQIFELAKDTTSVVFDKTGTLTKAKLKVKEIKSFSDLTPDKILAICAGIEQGSEHIIAKAILKKALDSSIKPVKCANFKALVGYGIQADFENQTYLLGSAQLFENLESNNNIKPIDSSKDALISIYLAKKTPKNLKSPNNGANIEVLGTLFLEDIIKESAPQIIKNLKANNIKPFILSGDNEANTARIAKILGIKDFKANAKPQDKLAFIKNLKQKGKVVMMIGDGVNDVGALEAADISVSFSNASDMSEKSANVIIFNQDLSRINYALKLSKAVVSNIKQNLFWAFCYNVICIPLACGVLYGFGILLNPMVAAFAMSASSVSVVLNAQKLRKFKE